MRILAVGLLLFIALTLGCSGQSGGTVFPPAEPAPSIGATDTGPTPVYVLAGQSNAAGNGPVAQLDASQATPAVDSYLYDDGSCAPDLAGHWVPITTGDGCTAQAIGPELAFAKSMPGPVYIIKYAVPSTSMDTFWRSPSAGGAFPGYVALLDAVRSALAAARIPGGAHLAALLWFQGESDAIDSAEAADTYQARLAAFIADFRTDTGAAQLPVVLAQVHLCSQEPWGAVVQSAQAAVAGSVPGVSMFPTEDLVLNPGEPDEDGESEYAVGQRFAAAVQAIPAVGLTIPSPLLRK
jgi:hypothetical protein